LPEGGTVVEQGGRVDLYDAESNRAGWGRKNADGSVELFDMQDNRIGETRGGRIILTDPAWLWRKEGHR
jgi:hypothetical protein